jgi:polar amino acid transport system substrate-binding protein
VDACRAALFLMLLMQLCLGLAGSRDASAQPAPVAQPNPISAQQITVVTRVLAPFVTQTGDVYGGFSVALWDAISQELGLATQWRDMVTVSDILGAVERGEAQAAIAAISITAQREEKFDFSQPMFESGLQILVRADGEAGLSLAQLWAMVSGGSMPWLIGLLALLIVLPAHLAWLAERRHVAGVFAPSYLSGIGQALWWATGAAVGQQPDYPRSVFGRLLSALAILVSVIFVAYFTAAVTSAMTVQQLKGDINGPEDLPGKRVATTRGSTSALHLASLGVRPVEVTQITDAFRALESRQVDAVVFDSPVLLYHAATLGKGKVRVVGPVFRKENYGILFPQGSPLRKRVNEVLLKLRENGAYDALYNRWFSALSAQPPGG